MKVLYLVDYLDFGGTQSLLKSLFKENNPNWHLFALRNKGINMNLINKNVYIYPSEIKYSFNPIKELKEVIEKEGIDILHCHLFRSQVFGYLLKKKYFPNIKLIFHEHGEIFQEHLIYNLFMKISIKYVNKYISVSKATKQKLIEKAGINPKKIVVLYNFVDLNRFNRKNIKWDIQKEREKLRIKKVEFVLGFSGRLAKVKGCEYLIKALPLLKFPYKVLIAGDGSERENLESLADKLNVKNKIIFLGYQSDMVKFYSLLDVLVVPSIHESFGLSVIEAQSMGIPIIVSNIEGLKEIINNLDGLLVNSKRPFEISEKINFLKDNPLKRRLFIQKGLKSIKKYSLKNYLIDLNRIYKDVK